MERLIKDANKVKKANGEMADLSIESFADVVEAIHIVQDEMGIAGATAFEAGTTIQGSVGAMEAAWTNLVTGLGDANSDINVLLDNFINSVGNVAKNVIPAVKRIVSSILSTLESRSPELIAEGAVLLGKLAVGLINAIPTIIAKIPQIVKEIVNSFKSRSGEFTIIGRNIVNGVWRGIQSMTSTFTRNVKKFFSGIVSSAKKVLGIRSPSRVFAEIGGFMAKGLDKGWEDEFGNVKKDIDDSLSFDDARVGIGTSVRSVGSGMSYGGASIGNITINIDGAKYNNEQSLASAIALEIQNMTDRRAAVYA